MDTAQAIGLSNGEVPTPYSEIIAWCSVSEVDLNLWEVETMKYFSTLYLSLLREYSDDKAERPYATEAGMAKLRQQAADLQRAQLKAIAK